MVERKKAAVEFLVAHEQFAEAVEPAVAHLDDPAPGLLRRIAPLDVGFLKPVNDVRDVAVRLDSAKVFPSAIARVGTQVLASPMWRALAVNDDGGEHFVKTLAVMDVAPLTTSDNGTPRPSTNRCLLLPFFPRSVGLGPAYSCANGAFNMAPSMLCQRQALPCIWSCSAIPARHTPSKKPAASHSRKRL